MTAVADLLETIVAAARRSAEVREQTVPLEQLRKHITRRPRGDAFRDALHGRSAGSSAAESERGVLNQEPRVIAECKRRSPSKGVLRKNYDPAAHAAAYAGAGAAAISVLTEPTFFDGSLDHLIQVRAAVDRPVLRKDFLVTEYQLVEAAACGADAVLLIAGALDDRSLGHLSRLASTLGLATLVEVHDLVELKRAEDAGATIIGVNSRNLRTLDVDLRVLEHVVAAMPAGVIAIAESGIRTSADIDRLTTLGYHAFLVGERLMTEADPGAALRILRGSGLTAHGSGKSIETLDRRTSLEP
jgi:indole-3-glycerol phosphate synthase